MGSLEYGIEKYPFIYSCTVVLLLAFVYLFNSWHTPIYDVARVAYQAITPLALFVHNEERKRNSTAAVQHLLAPLDKLLNVIMDCLLFKEFNSDMLDPAAEALIALICARRVIYACV